MRRATYRIEGHGEKIGDGWSDAYAGDGAAGITSLREAYRDVASLRRLGEEWRGPWRVVREQDGHVVKTWDAAPRLRRLSSRPGPGWRGTRRSSIRNARRDAREEQISRLNDAREREEFSR